MKQEINDAITIKIPANKSEVKVEHSDFLYEKIYGTCCAGECDAKGRKYSINQNPFSDIAAAWCLYVKFSKGPSKPLCFRSSNISGSPLYYFDNCSPPQFAFKLSCMLMEALIKEKKEEIRHRGEI